MNFFNRFFKPGIPQLNPDQAHARIHQSPKPLILDVRRPEEFRDGHIIGARLMPLDELTLKVNQLPKNKEIICVCRSGNRSGRATRQLIAAGFTATNLKGGMVGWSRSGLPVKKEGARRKN